MTKRNDVVINQWNHSSLRAACPLGEGGRSLREGGHSLGEGGRSLGRGGRGRSRAGRRLRADVEGGRGTLLSPGRDPLHFFGPLGAPRLAVIRARRKHGRVHRQLSRHRQPNVEPLVLVDAPVGIQLVGLIEEVEDIIRLA